MGQFMYMSIWCSKNSWKSPTPELEQQTHVNTALCLIFATSHEVALYILYYLSIYIIYLYIIDNQSLVGNFVQCWLHQKTYSQNTIS